MGDDEQHLADVVEHHHPVVQRRRTDRGGAGRRGGIRQVFGVADDVVPRVTDCPAAEARDIGKLCGGVPVEERLQFVERIVDGAFGGAAVLGERHLQAARFERDEGIAADETVTSDAFATDDTFEEEGVIAGAQFAEGGDRRQGVGQQLAVDGNEPDTLCKLREAFETGEVGHAVGA